MINELVQTFNDAADNGEASKEFELLLEGYKQLFGDKYRLFIYALLNHHSANLYDYLQEYDQGEFSHMAIVSPEIKNKAKQALAFEWGSGEQIEAENDVFKRCIDAGVFTHDDAESELLKATTQEMMEWVNTKCEEFINSRSKS